MNQVLEPLNNNINLVRGDYLEIGLNINIGTNLHPISLNIKDEVYRDYKVLFGLMEPNQAFEDSIMYKEYIINDDFINDPTNFTEDGDLIIKLFSQDTICLHPGEYYFSIKLKNPSTHQLLTVIDKSLFNIL